MREQFGLDYDNMREGLTIKINPKQWLSGFTEKTGIPTGAIANRIPKRLSGNWINHTLRSPTKLGASDGWGRKTGRYNKGGGFIPGTSGEGSRQGSTRLLPIGETLQRPRMGPQEDWLADLYSCLLYTSPSPRDRTRSRMPSSA